MSDNQGASPDKSSAKPGLWQEMKHRKVIRVATVYLVTGWLIIQIADTTFASFGIPEWAFRFVALMVALGLPVAIVLAWAFEVTPVGIKTSKSLTGDNNATPAAPVAKALDKKKNWHAYALGALVPTLIFSALVLYFVIQAGSTNNATYPALATADSNKEQMLTQSIAMMPLVNMSSLEENEYFAGGIHEDVLTNLSRIKNLQVKSRTAMLKYAATDMTLSEIGAELGVNYIVEGSVRRIGNHVRVTVQLIDASNENHLWANNFERELVDVFATQSELAKEISNSLHLEIQPESVEKLEGMPTTSVKAYDLFIKAQSLEKTAGETEESTLRRREMLELAVEEDPNFVEAWAVLNQVYDIMLSRLTGRGWYINEDEDLDTVAKDLAARSKRALEKAVALDPENVETLLATAVDHKWPKTAEEMRRLKETYEHIIATHPDNAMAWYHLGWWYGRQGESPAETEAKRIAAFEEALKRDPFNARIVYAALVQYRAFGDQENITRLNERLTQIIPATADDLKLARVSPGFKMRQARDAFYETADQTYVQEMIKIWEQRVTTDDFDVPIIKDRYEVEFSIYTNELERVLELASNPLPSQPDRFSLITFLEANVAALDIHQNKGQLEEAQLFAQRILESKEIVQSGNMLFPEIFDQNADLLAYLAGAYAVLREVEKARQLIEDAMVNTKLLRDEEFVIRIWVMSYIDLGRAVELAIAENARHPGWSGFDIFAAYHLNHPFLNHPRVREYYVKEGKWIDYLAERVPEYAQYKRKEIMQ